MVVFRFNKKKMWLVALPVFALVALATLFIPLNREASEPLDEVTVTDSSEVETISYKYGIPEDDYNVKYGIVKPRQNLSHILTDHGLSLRDVHNLNERSKGIFDVRKIRSGQAYAVFYAKDDSLGAPRYFVYEEDPKSYIVFHLQGDGRVTRGQNPVEWRRCEVKGQVESSLWVAMQSNNTSPQLAVVLSHIFGWSIDFFGLQKQDEFRVIYEQEYVDDKPLQNFHVLAAAFRASDSTYYAIPFVQDNEELYYNEHGNSLEGAFLKAPLDYYRISSRFSNARYHPVLKRYRAHHGVDYAAPKGTPVRAVADGVVIFKGWGGGGGNTLKIKHPGNLMTGYLHLSRFAKGIAQGTRVVQGQLIGYVGSTGASTGPHLDFRLWRNGKPIDPLKAPSEPAEPIAEKNRAAFEHVRERIMAELNGEIADSLRITQLDSIRIGR